MAIEHARRTATTAKRAGAAVKAAHESNDVVVSRVINAPRDVVFRAWTDAKQLAHWWGPAGFTNPVCEADPRPGGTYRIVMRSPEGTDYPVRGVYREVVKPERIIYTADLSDNPTEWLERVLPGVVRKNGGRTRLESLTTVMFEDVAGGTRLTVRTRFESDDLRKAMLDNGMFEGWTQSLERLETLMPTDLKPGRKTGGNGNGAHLASMAQHAQAAPHASTAQHAPAAQHAPVAQHAQASHHVEGRELVARRVLDAHRDRVFDMWTQAKHIEKWWGPAGFTVTIREMDVRPGGRWRFVMHGPDGRDYQNDIVYDEIVKPSRIVYRHVSEPHFTSTVTFDDVQGNTMLTVRMLFDSVEEMNRTMQEYKADEGLDETLDRLSKVLESRI